MRCCHWGTSSVLYSRSAYELWPFESNSVFIVEVNPPWAPFVSDVAFDSRLYYILTVTH